MRTRVCVFGASITWGMGDSQKNGWVERLRNYFEAEHYNAQIFNLGIPGNTTYDLLERFNVESKARQPDVIMFGLGGNDSCYINSEDNLIVPLDEFRENFANLIKQAKEFTEKVIVIGLTKVDESKTTPILKNKKKFSTNKNLELYDRAMKDVALSKGALFLPCIDLLGIDDLSDDGRHPDSVGHEKIFLGVKDFLVSNHIV